MVERFFGEITIKRIRRGVFKSVDELKQAIMDYLDKHNDQPKPYVWSKTAAEIFTKVARAAGRLYVGIIGSHSDKTLFNADIPGACLVGP
jgi:hypothetical protein